MSARFVPVADHAVLIEFGTVIDDATHAQVLALDRAIAAAPPAGLREVVPAYVNLLADVPANRIYEKFGFRETAPKTVGMAKRNGA